ncbi:uncharacterized protein YALI1_F33669g [Yarrowia lipolytica]|uniref:Uncharacterized protein n=1 Tax=Yarrowia lipolytica TaxID=4952 RepID=A0A1D8NQ22_YARLL|nr:hypothetical protein YALI1_F33669g [Yarrowia lipolytica]
MYTGNVEDFLNTSAVVDLKQITHSRPVVSFRITGVLNEHLENHISLVNVQRCQQTPRASMMGSYPSPQQCCYPPEFDITNIMRKLIHPPGYKVFCDHILSLFLCSLSSCRSSERGQGRQ